MVYAAFSRCHSCSSWKQIALPPPPAGDRPSAERSSCRGSAATSPKSHFGPSRVRQNALQPAPHLVCIGCLLRLSGCPSEQVTLRVARGFLKAHNWSAAIDALGRHSNAKVNRAARDSNPAFLLWPARNNGRVKHGTTT